MDQLSGILYTLHRGILSGWSPFPSGYERASQLRGILGMDFLSMAQYSTPEAILRVFTVIP